MILRSRVLPYLFFSSISVFYEDILNGKSALNELFVDKAHLALNDGAMFGKEGAGFMRLNVASPRSIIAEAMRRLKAAVLS